MVECVVALARCDGLMDERRICVGRTKCDRKAGAVSKGHKLDDSELRGVRCLCFAWLVRLE